MELSLPSTLPLLHETVSKPISSLAFPFTVSSQLHLSQKLNHLSSHEKDFSDVKSGSVANLKISEANRAHWVHHQISQRFTCVAREGLSLKHLMNPLRSVQRGTNLLKPVLKISPLKTVFPILPGAVHLEEPAWEDSVHTEGYPGISQTSMSTLEK